jgi:ABC-type amino acid transport substrate-binding protein
MQVLKKVLVSLVMAASMAAVSSTAFAEAKGEADVKAALEETISGITAAQAASKSGDLSGVSKDILEAANASKKFRFEPTERQRQKATDVLKSARKSFEAGDIDAGNAGLETALKSFTEMKAKYDLTH